MRDNSEEAVRLPAFASDSEGKQVDLQDLADELSRIAGSLHRAVGSKPSASAFSFDARSFGTDRDPNTRRICPPFPDPRLIRKIIRHRQLRARHFDRDLFADPAWDILLDLAAAAAEHKRISITSACTASGVPPTTALRWIKELIDAGLVERIEDVTDRRRAFVALTDRGALAVARFFADLGSGTVHFV